MPATARKLTPPMQRQLWETLNPTAARHLPTALAGARTGTNTVVALIDRGLLTTQTEDTGWRNILTDAGRAWTVEQLDAAHIAALWTNRDLAIEAHPYGSPEYRRAFTMLTRANLDVDVPIAWVRIDQAEADTVRECNPQVHTPQLPGCMCSLLGDAPIETKPTLDLDQEIADGLAVERQYQEMRDRHSVRRGHEALHPAAELRAADHDLAIKEDRERAFDLPLTLRHAHLARDTKAAVFTSDGDEAVVMRVSPATDWDVKGATNREVDRALIDVHGERRWCRLADLTPGWWLLNYAAPAARK